MSTFVSATVSTAQFALRDTFEEVPEAEFETVGVAAHKITQPIPFLWGWAPDLTAIDDALADDPTTATVRRISNDDDDRNLYRIGWASEVSSLLRIFVESDGTLLEADATDARWQFQLVFPTRDAASETYHRCRSQGICLEVRRVKDITNSMAQKENFLSKQQYEALVTAFETDYYRVPRGVTQEELAARLDVSHQALSERLRRGHQGLISNTLCNGSNDTKRYL